MGMWTITGTLAFIPLILYEYQLCRNIKKQFKDKQKSDKNFWFLLGTVILLLSCIMLGINSRGAAGIQWWSGLIVLVVGLLLYKKVLSIDGTEEYRKNQKKRPVSQSGLYAQMRHPGVWSFLICAIGYGMLFPEVMGSVLWFAFLNFIYTCLQDRYFFPVYLEGYEKYRREVPFLFPKCRLGKKENN